MPSAGEHLGHEDVEVRGQRSDRLLGSKRSGGGAPSGDADEHDGRGHTLGGRRPRRLHRGEDPVRATADDHPQDLVLLQRLARAALLARLLEALVDPPRAHPRSLLGRAIRLAKVNPW
jgi:hypothetical protein